MNYEEFKKLIENEYEEFFDYDYTKDYINVLSINIDGMNYHFKPKQKFPVRFEGINRDFFVYDGGGIDEVMTDSSILTEQDIKAFLNAVDLSRKIRGEKK